MRQFHLSVQIRNQFTFKRHDHVFQQQLAFLQAPDSQLVDHRVMLQSVDQVIEVPVTNPQFSQPVEHLKRFGIDFIRHSVMLLAVSQRRQPVFIAGSNDKKMRVQDVLFCIVFHRLTVERHDPAASLFDHCLGGRGVPF